MIGILNNWVSSVEKRILGAVGKAPKKMPKKCRHRKKCKCN